MEKILYSNYKDHVKGSQLTVIDLYADWCGPCKMLAPVLEKLQEQFSDVKIYKMDVEIEENKNLLRETQSQGIPTLLFYKNGDLIHKMSGYLPEQVLSKLIQDLK